MLARQIHLSIARLTWHGICLQTTATDGNQIGFGESKDAPLRHAECDAINQSSFSIPNDPTLCTCSTHFENEFSMEKKDEEKEEGMNK